MLDSAGFVVAAQLWRYTGLNDSVSAKANYIVRDLTCIDDYVPLCNQNQAKEFNHLHS